MQRKKINNDSVAGNRKPEWIKVPIPSGTEFNLIRQIFHQASLHTVCESALCPNIGTCWKKRHATVMILGGVCTRRCKFCAVTSGKPDVCDENEPVRVAETLERLGIDDVVLTSVTRDDLTDGGAQIWYETIRYIKSRNPKCSIEALIPDFGGGKNYLDIVLDASPDIISHNIETVPSLYPTVRPEADYNRSLQILKHAREKGMLVKSAIMVGLGESDEEIYQTMKDVYDAGAHIFFIGQYLRPTIHHLPVARYVHPTKFDELKKYGYKLGFAVVEANPLVRSSFPSFTQRAFVAKQKNKIGRVDEKI